MAKINPREHAETYKKQKELGEFQTPPDGTYIAVNTHLQFQYVGANKTKKLRATTRFLKLLDGNDASWVGKDWGQDFWMTTEADGSLKSGNVQQLAHAGLACGITDEWDPEKKPDLVRALTGVPYLITLRTDEEEYNGQKRKNTRVVERMTLTATEKKKFTDSPDWGKTIGEPAQRFMADKPGKDGGGNTGRGGGSSGGSVSTPVEDDPFASTTASDKGSKMEKAPF